MTKRSPFRYFKTSPEIIRLAVMMYVRFRFHFGTSKICCMSAGSKSAIRWFDLGGTGWSVVRLRDPKKTSSTTSCHSNWQWHFDEVFVKINRETRYLWRAVDHEGEVLESYVTKHRDRKAALKFLRNTIKRFGPPHVIVTDLLRSYGAAMKVVGNAHRQETGRWLNNRAENSYLPFRRRERAMLRFRRMQTLQKFVAVQIVGLQPFQPGTPPLCTRQFQAQPYRRSR